MTRTDFISNLTSLQRNKLIFVNKCGSLLYDSNSSLLYCEYHLGYSVNENNFFPDKLYKVDDEFVVCFCDCGYKYIINITANSMGSIAKAIFDELYSK